MILLTGLCSSIPSQIEGTTKDKLCLPNRKPLNEGFLYQIFKLLFLTAVALSITFGATFSLFNQKFVTVTNSSIKKSS